MCSLTLAAVTLGITAIGSGENVTFSTEWNNLATGSEWLDHGNWDDGIPDGQTTAIMRGVKKDSALDPYFVVVDDKGVTDQGTPAGMIVLSHGATLVLREGGVLDLSRTTGINEIKEWGSKDNSQPPSSKTGGRDWGTATATLPSDNNRSNVDETGDGVAISSSSSGGTIAGIVLAIIFVFILIIIAAAKYSQAGAAAGAGVVGGGLSTDSKKMTIDNPIYSESAINPEQQQQHANAPAHSSNAEYIHIPEDEDGYLALASRAHTAEGEDAELYDPVYTMSPLSDLEDTPVVSLDRAVATAAEHCGGGPYDEQIELANTFYDEKISGGQGAGSDAALSRVDATAIHIYTQATNIYKGLNGALGGYGKGGRDALVHYYQLLKLLIIATRKLPPIEPTTVYRGIQLDHMSLLGGLTVGDRLTWWGVTSTTRTADVLRDDMFLGSGSTKADGTLRKDSKRTVFQIRANAGVDISGYSAVRNEDELLLLPGSTFVIEEIIEHPYNVVEIKMRQVESVSYHIGSVETAGELPVYDTIADDNYEFESYDTYSGLTDNQTLYSGAGGAVSAGGGHAVDDGAYDTVVTAPAGQAVDDGAYDMPDEYNNNGDGGDGGYSIADPYPDDPYGGLDV